MQKSIIKKPTIINGKEHNNTKVNFNEEINPTTNPDIKFVNIKINCPNLGPTPFQFVLIILELLWQIHKHYFRQTILVLVLKLSKNNLFSSKAFVLKMNNPIKKS